MASSKLMSRNSDLKRKLSVSSSSESPDAFSVNGGYVERSSTSGEPANADGENSKAPRKTVDDVWREILAGKKKEQQTHTQTQQPKEEMMTLEDFLVKAGAVEKDKDVVEVKKEVVSVVESSGGVHAYENAWNYSGGMIGLGVDSGRMGSLGSGSGSGRGARSLSLLEPLDKVAQQRQRRMIKNRESAARSRERKQAYQEELESMAMRLEEENERLLREKAEQTKKRLKQLMENVIPIAEKRRPPRVLRKVRSMQW